MISVIGLTGFSGRMGQSIAEVVLSHPNACLGGGVVRDHLHLAQPAPQEKSHIVTTEASHLFPHCDVIIDFSHASAVAAFAQHAAENGKAFLSGTTGLAKETMDMLKDISRNVPVLYATNTSLSLVVVRQVIKLAAKLLKDHDYDISILDKHHRWKKDAPSGTALSLGTAVRQGNGGEPEPTYASLRAGSIVGEHDVLFAGHGETITISHQVTDRRVFARGAVEAALWLAKQPAGFYTIDDVLGDALGG